MTLKKLKKHSRFFFGFLDKLMVKELWKTKKNSGLFLVFCMDCCYMSFQNLSKNQKRPEFFCFFALLQVRVPSKNQKNLEFFFVFSRSCLKNSRKTKKNQTWASDQTFSEKFCFFGFLVFSSFFGFCRGLASRICGAVTSGPYLILVLQLCFPSFVAIYRKTHSITGLWYPLFPWENAFPQNMSGNLFQTSFFEDRTCSKGSSLPSLKTGLFQREVACKEESSIWTNRLSVKQGFFSKEKVIIWTELVRWWLSFKKKYYLERKWIIRKNVY